MVSGGGGDGDGLEQEMVTDGGGEGHQLVGEQGHEQEGGEGLGVQQEEEDVKDCEHGQEQWMVRCGGDEEGNVENKFGEEN